MHLHFNMISKEEFGAMCKVWQPIIVAWFMFVIPNHDYMEVLQNHGNWGEMISWMCTTFEHQTLR